jgi:hypothetical protein
VKHAGDRRPSLHGDGIVAWQACIDKWSPDVSHVEVDETHVGLILSPRVLAIVADEIERS